MARENCANCGQLVEGDGYNGFKTLKAGAGKKFCCESCADEYIAKHPTAAKINGCFTKIIIAIFIIIVAMILLSEFGEKKEAKESQETTTQEVQK